MAIHALQAAKHLAEQSGYKLTRLELQRMCYLAHMVYLGTTNMPLVKGDFEARKLGPVHDDLHSLLGSTKSNVPDAGDLDYVQGLGEEKHKNEIFVLEKILEVFPPPSGAKLIQVTCWSRGAWARRYNRDYPDEIIREKDIRKEYAARFD